MAKTKQQKTEILAAYTKRIESSKGFIVIEHTQLTPQEINNFKKELLSLGSQFNVIKNSIFKLAMQQKELLTEQIETGVNAVIYLTEDLPAIGKALKAFGEQNKEKIKIKFGFLGSQKLEESSIKAFAEMPTKDESIAQIAGLLQQSMVGVVNVLEDSVRSIATIIDRKYSTH